MKYAARTDANHAEVVKALRAAGATVHSLAAVGNGMPDLLCGFRNHTILFEVKDGSKSPSRQKLRPLQIKWHATWQGGTLATVDGPEAALRMLGAVA